MLEKALVELDQQDRNISETFIEDYDLAQTERFVGSPTFRIDGEDLYPAGENDHFGLSCRVYKKPDGRFSPLPEYQDLLQRISSKLN
jgi:hypothetical protein